MFSDKQFANTSGAGSFGEEVAAEYLAKSGIRIFERNHRNVAGEIDIIGISDDGTLIFFEVKTIYNYGNDNALTPEDNFSSAKRRKLIKSCEVFVAKHPDLISERGWRIDLIALTINTKDYEIKVYENV